MNGGNSIDDRRQTARPWTRVALAHACLGAPLACIEGQVAFATLFGRYPELRLAVPDEEVRWGGSFLRGFARLPVLF